MNQKDTYKTILVASPEVLYKEKNSKFFGYAFPINTEDEVKPILETLKKLQPNARHYCYAYQIGTETKTYKANDDGEPSNTAGTPIYGQIQSFDVTNILIVIIRFFGGIKLGVGGLISAYRTTSRLVLEQCNIEERTIDIACTLRFPSKKMNVVMRVIKENQLVVTAQETFLPENTNELMCIIEINIRKKNIETAFTAFENLFEVDIKRK